MDRLTSVESFLCRAHDLLTDELAECGLSDGRGFGDRAIAFTANDIQRSRLYVEWAWNLITAYVKGRGNVNRPEGQGMCRMRGSTS